MAAKKPYPYFVPGEAEAFEQAWRSLSTQQRNFRSKDDVRMGWMMAAALAQQAETEDVKAAVQNNRVFTRLAFDERSKGHYMTERTLPVGVYTKAVLHCDLRMVVPTDQKLSDILGYIEDALGQWKGQTPEGDWWHDMEIQALTPVDVTA